MDIDHILFRPARLIDLIAALFQNACFARNTFRRAGIISGYRRHAATLRQEYRMQKLWINGKWVPTVPVPMPLAAREEKKEGVSG